MQGRSTRGAAAELSVCAQLMHEGYDVFRSQSPHAPFDLVRYKDGLMERVEVKTLSIFQDKKGSRTRHWTTTLPTNNEWDVLYVVYSDGRCWSFPFGTERAEIMARIREDMGDPPPA